MSDSYTQWRPPAAFIFCGIETQLFLPIPFLTCCHCHSEQPWLLLMRVFFFPPCYPHVLAESSKDDFNSILKAGVVFIIQGISEEENTNMTGAGGGDIKGEKYEWLSCLCSIFCLHEKNALCCWLHIQYISGFHQSWKLKWRQNSKTAVLQVSTWGWFHLGENLKYYVHFYSRIKHVYKMTKKLCRTWKLAQ